MALMHCTWIAIMLHLVAGFPQKCTHQNTQISPQSFFQITSPAGGPNRRQALTEFIKAGSLAVAASLKLMSPAIAQIKQTIYEGRGNLTKVVDPNTYSALVYAPTEQSKQPLPLLVFLHGAGKNERDVWNLADIKGEHAGLVPSLIASDQAPVVLTNNFAVVSPYCGQGKRSFYEEPRSKILQFITWVSSDAGREAGCPEIDPNRIYLFGFSDGATEAVELLTTQRFQAGVIAAYGFTGTLPSKAIERLHNIPMWIFHSADDAIFPVKCSDQLVKILQGKNSKNVIRYSRFQEDQEGFTGSVRGHSTGITASRTPEVYEWLLSI